MWSMPPLSRSTAAGTITRYLESDSGGHRRSLIQDGTLSRIVGVNRETWRPWVQSGSTELMDGVLEGGTRAIDSLVEGGVGNFGTHHVGRAQLVDASRKVHDTAGRVCLFVLTMMWGSGTTNGRGPRNTAKAIGDSGLDDVLRDTCDLACRYQLSKAYHRFRVSGIGPSFFTKWFWSCSLKDPLVSKRPLILDERVLDSVNQLGILFKPMGRNRADRYDRYVQMLASWAEEVSEADLRVSQEHLEWLLFDREPRCLLDWLQTQA